MASRTSTTLRHPAREQLSFVQVLAALSDPLRLGIVARLGQLDPEDELPCVAFALPVSKSTQSGHFRMLREAGVINQRDRGTKRLNRLRRDDLEARFPGLVNMAIQQGRAIGVERSLAEGSDRRSRTTPLLDNHQVAERREPRTPPDGHMQPVR